MINMFVMDGFITSDLDLKEANGKKYVRFRFSPATHNKEHSYSADPIWISAFGAQASYLCTYGTKGSRINVQGTIKGSKFAYDKAEVQNGRIISVSKSITIPNLIVTDVSITHRKEKIEKVNLSEDAFDSFGLPNI